LPGRPSIDKVAGPVGEALIMTALGLAVRGPRGARLQLAGRRNKVAMELVRHFGGGVHMPCSGGRALGRRTMSMNLGNVEGDDDSSPTSTPRRSST